MFLNNKFLFFKHKDTKKQSSFSLKEDTESSKAAYKGHKIVPRLPQGFVATFKSLVTFKSTFYTKITK